MSPKKRSKKSKGHRKTSKGTFTAARGKAKEKTPVQAIAIGVIAVVVIAIIWISISSQKGEIPKLVGTRQYSGPPPMLIDTNKQYFATVKMAEGGEFVIELYPKKAPITVNSFVFLARQGYFDGVTFHRVLEGFMAQGGDPTGTGGGGPGYTFANELNDLKFDKAGWGSPLPEGRGRGVAVHSTWGVSPCAQVAEVSVDANGQVRVHRVVLRGREAYRDSKVLVKTGFWKNVR